MDSKRSTTKPKQAPLSKALRYQILAMLWIFPSIGAVFIIGRDCARLFNAPSLDDALRGISFEQWVAIVLLLLQFYFAANAIYYRKHKEPESID